MKRLINCAPRWAAWLVGILTALVPLAGHAQPPWSGIIAPTRATDWRTVGVRIMGQPPGIPARTTACATIAPYTGSAATINNAIAACPSGQVVQLQAGTFTLSSGINIARSNVTLRGAGAASTRLVINGGGNGCGDFRTKAVTMCTGNSHYGDSSSYGGPQHSATWSSGYAKGTTVVTLSNTTGLEVGSTIMLDQTDDAVTNGLTDGWPGAGDMLMCSSTPPCSADGGGTFLRGNRVQVEIHQVTAINGTNVTIDPPVHAPNFRASQSPGAWWGNNSGGTVAVIQNSGIEDLAVDFTGSGQTGLYALNVTNSWVKNTRWIRTGGPGSFVYHIIPVQAFRFEVRDSYFYGPNVQGNTQYTYAASLVGSSLFENNIIHAAITPIATPEEDVGSVTAYNYIDGSHYSSYGEQKHGTGDMYVLSEGNNFGQLYSDNNHGTHHFMTLFRNHLDRDAHAVSTGSSAAGFVLTTHSRFWNLIGNISGHPSWTTYQNLGGSTGNEIYSLGWQGNCSNCGPMPSNDTNVNRTLMRWGNWDSVTASTRFVATEVPSDIANFANPVPTSQALPASLYRSSQPAWWTTAFGTPPWPAIGPDVSNGNIASSTGGHANKIPARLCFENTGLDPAYASSNPRIRLFDARACYAQTTGTAPSAPGAPTLQ